MIDASNFSLYAKVFGNEKTTNAITESKPKKGDSKGYRDQGRPPFKPFPQQKGSNPSKTKDENPIKKEEPFGKNSPRPPQSEQGKPVDPKEGPSKPRTLEMLVEAHRPPRSYECLFCRQTNHALEQCRNYRGSLCMVCGFKGFETQNCPYCQKNELQTVRNRRPSNPSA